MTRKSAAMGAVVASAAIALGPVALAGCTTHGTPVTQKAPETSQPAVTQKATASPQPTVALPGDPNSDVPCDDVIITFSSWFCPIHPTGK